MLLERLMIEVNIQTASPLPDRPSEILKPLFTQHLFKQPPELIFA